MRKNRMALLFSLAVVVAMVAFPVLGADNKKKQNEQKRRENQARLRALEREESTVRQQIQQVEKQVSQLKKKLPSVQQALQAMTGQARMARDQLEDTKAETKRISEQHNRLAEELVAEQSADSPFGKLRDRCEKVRKDYTAAMDAVRYSDRYKNAASALVRKGLMDKDPNVIAARELLVRTQKEFEAARLEVLSEEPDWRQSMNDLKATKEQENRVDNQTKSVLGRYATALREVNSTKSKITKLEGSLRQGRSILNKVVNAKQNVKRQLGGGQNKKSQPGKKKR